MRQIEVKEAVDILQCKGNRYVSMINFLQLNPVESLIADHEIIAGRFWSDDGKLWTVLAADSIDEVNQIHSYWCNDERFAVLEDWMYPRIIQQRNVVWDEPCYTYYVPDEALFPEQGELPNISLDYVDVIQKYWSYDGDWTRRFIINCLQRGLSSLKLVDGKPIAWASMQDDGAMGFMFVLPEYRSKGYAKEVSIDLIQKMRVCGRLPFVHIVHTNQTSLSLVKSMGFKLLKKIYWLEVK